jgi:hypothetical protein
MSIPMLFWEDRLKWGENFITDKIVKISEALGGEQPFGWSPLVKSYIEGEHDIELWFRLTTVQGNSYDFLAFLKSATSVDCDRAFETALTNPSSVWQLDNSHWATGTDCSGFMASQHKARTSVFVIVPEAIENPERMQVWVCPSFVWLVGLETFNDVYGSLREALETFQFGRKVSTRLTYRKVQVLQDTLGASRKIPKLPNQVVQNGAEVMDTIPSDETQTQWRLFPTLHLNPQELLNTITVFLGHHCIFNTFNEPSGLTLEVLHMFPSSFQAPVKVFEVGGHE